ncbi:MAG: NADH-quinone oxidoreductase subunit NuoH [Verrucomicrobiales bacterium]|jgi:NADH-quinone oxidoreductase subunit H|nr:NADH-quinone oxidoreductase subunit NuoH [Verrucomicrobiota bacterium]MEC7903080.1 NADH-quinone oxidoreductase subunit NuoH [Verrucomicrobiota bacterium]MEC8720421.1 NADH-quinone oxidoreductase subunit NuoH [Verrucomicrobiota bacterium]
MIPDFINDPSHWGHFLFWSGFKVVMAFALIMPMVAYSVMLERRVSAAIQDRIGPNRVGPFGILQPMADGLKAILKEDFTPSHVRRIYFILAPAISMIPAFLTVAVIPFGSKMGSQSMVIADLNVGILYTFSIVSLGVYGIVLAGYASNSKYPFLGGIRASAQMISYEIAMGMAAVPVFMLVGDLNLGKVIAYQADGAWLVFKQPIAFVIFLVSAFAETNRLPFDMPESETELVSGYNTEYSSMKFALFFMGEYAAMISVSALMVTLFFGGWTLPFFGLNETASTLAGGILQILVFLGKIACFMVLFVWIRWMVPRFRYDQLMDLGWKRFLPLALANIIITAIILWMQHL